METREDILKELKEIAPKLAAMDKTNPYQVPEGYFLNFKNVMLDKIVLEADLYINPVMEELKAVAPELAKIQKHSVAEMPVNYFNDFSAQLIKKIRANEVANELAEVAPALSIIEKVNELEVPAVYFKAFPQRMMQLVKAEQKGSISFSSQWLGSLNELLERVAGVVFKPKYAVAFAGFASVLIVAVMLLVKIPQGDNLDAQLAQLSTEEINNYLDNKSDAYSDEVFEMNIDEKVMPAAEKISTLHTINDALKDVDDAALNDAITD